jgi:hypothetical protein
MLYTVSADALQLFRRHRPGFVATCDSQAIRRRSRLKVPGASAQTADQQEYANHRKREAKDHYRQRHKLLMVRLAFGGAVRDQQNQAKEGGGENADEDERDPQDDPPDRFQGVVTGLSLRRLDVDHKSGRITQLDCTDARCLRRPAPQLATASKSPSCPTSCTTGRL